MEIDDSQYCQFIIHMVTPKRKIQVFLMKTF